MLTTYLSVVDLPVPLMSPIRWKHPIASHHIRGVHKIFPEFRSFGWRWFGEIIVLEWQADQFNSVNYVYIYMYLYFLTGAHISE